MSSNAGVFDGIKPSDWLPRCFEPHTLDRSLERVGSTGGSLGAVLKIIVHKMLSWKGKDSSRRLTIPRAFMSASLCHHMGYLP